MKKNVLNNKKILITGGTGSFGKAFVKYLYSQKDIKLSKMLGTNCIEIHTGKLSNLIKKNKNYSNELKKIYNSTKYATKLGVEVHAGHGMDYKTTRVLSKIKDIKEFNIGHFIIGESVFNGLKKTIKYFKKISK